MKKRKKYEVCFAIEGETTEECADIGSAISVDEWENEDGTFSQEDCRAEYCVSAISPEEAYKKAVKLFEEDDFEELEITDWSLEHIYCKDDDRLWHKKDLKIFKYKNKYEVCFASEYKNVNGKFTQDYFTAKFYVNANSPEEAYKKALKLFEEQDFGKFEMSLDHIYYEYNNRYWYKEDLDI